MRYQKSASGQLAFKQRSGDISTRQRSAFLLFDGNRSVAEVLATTSGLGVTQADVDDLIAKGFLTSSDGQTAPASQPTPAGSGSAGMDSPAAAQPPTPNAPGSGMATATTPAANVALDEQTIYRQAYPVATKLTASLGLRGFRLNLAVEAASGYQDLVALLPQITQAVGPTAAQELKKALRLG